MADERSVTLLHRHKKVDILCVCSECNESINPITAHATDVEIGSEWIDSNEVSF